MTTWLNDPDLVARVLETLHDGVAMTKLVLIKAVKENSHGAYGLRECKECVDLLINQHIIVIARTETKKSDSIDYDIHYWAATHST